MATVTLQFQVNGGTVSTGAATVVAEDEIDLRLASYAGLQSIRYEIQAFPDGFAQPTGWSTDVSSGAYYFNASPIVGLTPPTITMPTTAEIAAGQWGKWIFRAIATTSTGTITSDPRCGVKIVSPSLGLNGIAFSEEDEFDAARAYPGELQEDLVEIDAAAIVSGGFVSSAAATRPIKVSGSTGAVTWSWEPNANVGMLGYGFTSCSSVTNAGGALAVTAGGGAASLAGGTTATVSANGGALLCEGATTTTITAGTALAMTGATTASLTATAGALTCTGGTTAALTASAGAVTITASTEVNVSPLLNVRRNDATANTILDVATLRRTTSDAGFGQTGIGGRLAFELEDSAGNADVAGTLAVDYLDATSTSEDARILFRAQVAGTLTDSLSLRGTTIRAHGLAGSGAGFVTVDNNGDFGFSVGSGAPADAYYLVTASNGSLSNEIVISGVSSPLNFGSSAGLPAQFTRTDAATDSMLDALDVRRLSATVGAVGIGVGAVLYSMDAGGDEVQVGRVSGEITDATASAHASTLGFWAATAGGLVQVGTWTGAGAFASTGTVTAGTGGFLGTAWDTATATSATIGAANMTALTVTPSTTFNGTVTKTGTGLTTTVVPGFVATNTTAATAGVTVQNGYAYVSVGSGWESGGGGSPKTVRAGFAVQPVSSGSIGLNYRLVTDVGTGTLAFVNTYYTTSVPGFGGSAWTSQTFVAWSDIGNGYRLITTGGTEYGALKVSSDSTVLEAKRNTSTGRGEIWSNITTGSTDDGVRIWNYAGTRSAGNLLAVGAGAAWTGKWAVRHDGATLTPTVDAYASGALTVGSSVATSVDQKPGGTTRVSVTSAGAQTHSLDAASTVRTQWGTAGVNYVDETADVTTTTDNTTTDVFTFAMADNSTLEWEVYTWAYDVVDPARRRYFAKRGAFSRSGGAPVSDWEEDIYTDKFVGGWGGGISLVFTEGAPSTNDVSIQATGLSGRDIKWISQIKYRVRTTSA